MDFNYFCFTAMIFAKKLINIKNFESQREYFGHAGLQWTYSNVNGIVSLHIFSMFSYISLRSRK